MQPFSLAPIPEIAFGQGRFSELPERVTGFAGKGMPVMIIADPAMTALGITAKLVKLLAEAGHDSALYEGFKGEPKSGDIDQVAARAREARAKVVVGLGGGTALDTAKLVASCAVSGKPAEAYQGVADVRNAIARFGQGPVRETIEPASPAFSHLDAALFCMAGADSLRAAIVETRPDLRWITYDAYPRDMIGRRFPVAHAFVSLIGGTGFIPADDFELGLLLIAPKTLYRDHRHKAPELYVPLTGPHEWRFGIGESWTEYKAHIPIWNEPMQVHATLVRDIPFLALFAWTRDVTADSVVVQAPDWAEIEAGL